MVHCGELCYAEGIVTASIRVLSSIATHGRHDVEAVSCGYSEFFANHFIILSPPAFNLSSSKTLELEDANEVYLWRSVKWIKEGLKCPDVKME
uniref:Uncharacterized protein n=1 Tax=Oryza sativa subsp. japonica TaxID=39947 RepID=Q8H375_ORYSJ|nr:hypothetical protein [Oryza sativa Japonica Group]